MGRPLKRERRERERREAIKGRENARRERSLEKAPKCRQEEKDRWRRHQNKQPKNEI